MQESKLSRRSLLAAAAGCGCARPRDDALTVFTWAGPWGRVFEQKLGPRFEAATGARVRFDNGWGEEIPKLLIAPPDQPPYDVMIVAPFEVYAVIRRGHFQKLDWRRIPNAKNFHPNALDNWVAGEDWGLTWPDALHAGVHRSGLEDPPESWAAVLDRNPGLYRAAYMTLYTFAAARWPGHAAEAIQQDFAGVFAYARERRREVRHWWATSPDMAFSLRQGAVDAGNIHSVDGLGMVSRGEPVELFVTADRAHFQAIWLIPRGGRRPDLAHEFLNQFASVDFQREYAAAGFPTPVPEVAREQAADDALWASVHPYTDEHFRGLHYYPYDAYTENWTRMTEGWKQEVLV